MENAFLPKSKTHSLKCTLLDLCGGIIIAQLECFCNSSWRNKLLFVGNK